VSDKRRWFCDAAKKKQAKAGEERDARSEPTRLLALDHRNDLGVGLGHRR
jgi:hypothetical protein